MNLKQLYNQNKLKSLVTDSSQKKQNSYTLDLTSIFAENDKPATSHLDNRLKQLEDQNDNLKICIEQHEKELKEVIATNNKFISIIAHDLRSPFGSIMGALELLKNKMDEYNITDIDKYINIATESAIKTLNLLESLLEWLYHKTMRKHSIRLKSIYTN